MGLKLNEKEIEYGFVKNMEEAERYTEQARKNLNGLAIPNNYPYLKTLSNIKEDLSTYVKKIQNFKQLISEYVEKINNAEKQNADLINSLSLNLGSRVNDKNFSLQQYIRELKNKKTELSYDSNEYKVLLQENELLANIEAWENLLPSMQSEVDKIEKKLSNTKLSESERQTLENEKNSLKSDIRNINASVKHYKKLINQAKEFKEYYNITKTKDYQNFKVNKDRAELNSELWTFGESGGVYLPDIEVYNENPDNYKYNPLLIAENFYNKYKDKYAYGNKKNGSVIDVYMSEGGSGSYYLRSYMYMTEDQRNMYNYLYEKKGLKSADNYLQTIEKSEFYTMQRGEYDAKKLLNTLTYEKDKNGNKVLSKNSASTVLKTFNEGVHDGISNFSEGIANLFESEENITDLQYKQMYLYQYLGGASKISYEFGQTYGNMLPVMIIGAFLPNVATVALGASATGNSKQQALQKGYSLGEAWSYGIMSGLSEVALERFIGSIPGISKNGGLSSLVKSDSRLLKYAAEIVSEGSEEYIQEYVQAGIDKSFGEDVDWGEVNQNAIKSFGMGAALGGITNATKPITNVINSTKYSDIVNDIDNIDIKTKTDNINNANDSNKTTSANNNKISNDNNKKTANKLNLRGTIGSITEESSKTSEKIYTDTMMREKIKSNKTSKWKPAEFETDGKTATKETKKWKPAAFETDGKTETNINEANVNSSKKVQVNISSDVKAETIKETTNKLNVANEAIDIANMTKIDFDKNIVEANKSMEISDDLMESMINNWIQKGNSFDLGEVSVEGEVQRYSEDKSNLKTTRIEIQSDLAYNIINDFKSKYEKYSTEEKESYIKLNEEEIQELFSISKESVYKYFMDNEGDFSNNVKSILTKLELATKLEEEHTDDITGMIFGNSKKDSLYQYDYRIYLNSGGEDNNYAYEFIAEYVKKCIENDISYNMKGLNNNGNRKDGSVLYVKEADFQKTVKILQELSTERPDLVEKLGQGMYLMAKIPGLNESKFGFSKGLIGNNTSREAISNFFKIAMINSAINVSAEAKSILENNVSKDDVEAFSKLEASIKESKLTFNNNNTYKMYFGNEECSSYGEFSENEKIRKIVSDIMKSDDIRRDNFLQIVKKNFQEISKMYLWKETDIENLPQDVNFAIGPDLYKNITVDTNSTNEKTFKEIIQNMNVNLKNNLQKRIIKRYNVTREEWIQIINEITTKVNEETLIPEKLTYQDFIKELSKVRMKELSNKSDLFDKLSDYTKQLVLNKYQNRIIDLKSMTELDLDNYIFDIVMNIGETSDPKLLELMKNTFNNEIKNENLYAGPILKKIIELKSRYPELNFNIDMNGESYWKPYDKTLCLGNKHLAWKNEGALCHEIGHLLYTLVLNEELPNNWEKIVDNARRIASNSDLLSNFCTEILKRNSLAFKEASKYFSNILKNNGYVSIKQYEQHCAKKYYNELYKNKYYIKEICRDIGIKDNDVIQQLELAINNGASLDVISQKMAKQHIIAMMNIYRDKINRTEYGAYETLSDIIDAIFLGEEVDIKGNKIMLTYKHGKSYYDNEGESKMILQFHEIIANYNKLKILGEERIVDAIKYIFGNEFYDTLESTYRKFYN